MMPYENLNILFFNDLYGIKNQSLVRSVEKLWQEYFLFVSGKYDMSTRRKMNFWERLDFDKRT